MRTGVKGYSRRGKRVKSHTRQTIRMKKATPLSHNLTQMVRLEARRHNKVV